VVASAAKKCSSKLTLRKDCENWKAEREKQTAIQGAFGEMALKYLMDENVTPIYATQLRRKRPDLVV
jgi:hypothetical protein